MEKKELEIRYVGNCCKIFYEGGGELPAALKGLYTSKAEAERAISLFRATAFTKSKPPKKKAASVVKQGPEVLGPYPKEQIKEVEPKPTVAKKKSVPRKKAAPVAKAS
jgi:hypothetical protein